VKPDYLPTEDLDCLIVGGYFSQGIRKGGKMTVWLLAVADDKDKDLDGHPKRFLTFCKVRLGQGWAGLGWGYETDLGLYVQGIGVAAVRVGHRLVASVRAPPPPVCCLSRSLAIASGPRCVDGAGLSSLCWIHPPDPFTCSFFSLRAREVAQRTARKVGFEHVKASSFPQ